MAEQERIQDEVPANNAALEHRIRRRAYQIWMEEGQPDGKDREHFVRAKAEVLELQPHER